MRKKEILKDLTMLSSILILGLVHAQLKVVAGVRILIRMEVVALPRADLLFVLDEQLILRLASGLCLALQTLACSHERRKNKSAGLGVVECQRYLLSKIPRN